MKGVSKRFGATQALRDVSLQLRAGQVLALIGENGAGKSTLMSILSGAVAADTGVIEIDGRPIRPNSPLDSRSAGIAMIYQELNLAPDLSVEANILLGQERHRWGFLSRSAQIRQARAALALLGHENLPLEVPLKQLSVGLQQIVEIARALVGNTKVLVLDEPTSSLTRSDTENLFKTIERLASQGLGIIYISHFLEEVRRVCDSYLVLRDGANVADGLLADATEAQIISSMAGRGVDDLYPTVPHELGPPLMSIASLSGLRQPIDVSFEVCRGEILGLFGLIGSGRTELARAIFALEPVRSGRVRIASISPKHSPKSRIHAGLGYVSEDRKAEGLAQAQSIADNMTYSRLSPYSRGGFLNLKKRRDEVLRWMKLLEVRATAPEDEVQSLSGGNQQKVAIARALHQGADVLLLDEPTRGIDIGTKSAIYRLIGDFAAQEKAVLFISSYLPELLQVCDRIGVMSRGKLREIRPAGEWSEQSLLSRAIETV